MATPLLCATLVILMNGLNVLTLKFPKIVYKSYKEFDVCFTIVSHCLFHYCLSLFVLLLFIIVCLFVCLSYLSIELLVIA